MIYCKSFISLFQDVSYIYYIYVHRYRPFTSTGRPRSGPTPRIPRGLRVCRSGSFVGSTRWNPSIRVSSPQTLKFLAPKLLFSQVFPFRFSFFKRGAQKKERPWEHLGSNFTISPPPWVWPSPTQWHGRALPCLTPWSFSSIKIHP